jgi:hypothetical protein
MLPTWTILTLLGLGRLPGKEHSLFLSWFVLLSSSNNCNLFRLPTDFLWENMLSLLFTYLLTCHLFHLSYAFPAPTIDISPSPAGQQTTYLSPSLDPYANSNPTAWQNNVICGPSNRDIGFDPSITQRLTTQFCTDLLGYLVSPGQSAPSIIVNHTNPPHSRNLQRLLPPHRPPPPPQPTHQHQ